MPFAGCSVACMSCLGGHVYVPRGLGSSEHLSCHVKFRLADVVSQLWNRYMVRQSSCCMVRFQDLAAHAPSHRRPLHALLTAAAPSSHICPHLRRTMMQCPDKFGSNYAVPDPRTKHGGMLTISIPSPDKRLHAYGTRDPYG